MRFLTVLPDLVIPNGATDSNVIDTEIELSDATKIGLLVGASGAGKIKVSNDNVTFFDHTDLVASKAVSLDPLPFKYLKVTLSVAAVGAVHVGLSKQWES